RAREILLAGRFGYEVADARQRLANVVLRVRVGKAQIAPATLSESGPGEHGHADLVQQAVGEVLLVEPGLADVRERVEGALRLDARDARDGVQAVHHD